MFPCGLNHFKTEPSRIRDCTRSGYRNELLESSDKRCVQWTQGLRRVDTDLSTARSTRNGSLNFPPSSHRRVEMNSSDTPAAYSSFSLRSLLALLFVAGLMLMSVRQHQQNQNLRHMVETLTSRVEHLEASNEHSQAKFEKLVRHVRDEPVLTVPRDSNSL